MEIMEIKPSPVAEAIAEAARLWKASDGAKLDTRLAERGGVVAEIEAAKAAESAAIHEWHNAFMRAKNAATAMLAELGISAADFRSVL